VRIHILQSELIIWPSRAIAAMSNKLHFEKDTCKLYMSLLGWQQCCFSVWKQAFWRGSAAISESNACSTLRHIIAECMQILCPQGFLEISCIDIDPKNMDPCTRKAIRALKEHMRTVQPNISLQPASNGIQAMLGHCGFENLHRYFVGLPCNGSQTSQTYRGPHARDELSSASGNLNVTIW